MQAKRACKMFPPTQCLFRIKLEITKEISEISHDEHDGFFAQQWDKLKSLFEHKQEGE